MYYIKRRMPVAFGLWLMMSHLCLQIITTVRQSIENLARGAVFIEQARLDQNTSNVADFREIENQGVYWLMCEMKRFLVEQEKYVKSDVTRDVMSSELRGVTPRSTLQMRDYNILDVLWKILDKVHADFTMLKDHVER